MDDGYWPLSILILVGFILIDAVLYGFGSAIQNLNVNSLKGGGRRKRTGRETFEADQ